VSMVTPLSLATGVEPSAQIAGIAECHPDLWEMSIPGRRLPASATPAITAVAAARASSLHAGEGSQSASPRRHQGVHCILMSATAFLAAGGSR
jgi:hypothetical protein